MASLQDEFAAVDLLVAANMRRVLRAFANARVGRHVSAAHGDLRLASTLAGND